jgi:hypothetical protein
MKLSRTLGVAAATLVLGAVAISGQNRVPGPDLAGIAETKAMHAGVIQAIETNTRTQIVIARLASLDARVAALTLQVVDAQRAYLDATRARIDTETEIRRLSQIQPRTQPQPRASTPQEVVEQQQVLADRQREEQAARGRLSTLQRSLDAEQSKRTDLNSRLDDLERSLGR